MALHEKLHTDILFIIKPVCTVGVHEYILCIYPVQYVFALKVHLSCQLYTSRKGNKQKNKKK